MKYKILQFGSNVGEYVGKKKKPLRFTYSITSDWTELDRVEPRKGQLPKLTPFARSMWFPETMTDKDAFEHGKSELKKLIEAEIKIWQDELNAINNLMFEE